MTIQVETFTAPAYWASALINGDTTGMEDKEIATMEAWCESIAPWEIIDVVDNCEPYFTWDYAQYESGIYGGDVLDYIAHKR